MLVALERVALSSFFAIAIVDRALLCFFEYALLERRPVAFNVKLIRVFVWLYRQRFVLRETDTDTPFEAWKEMADTSLDRMVDTDKPNG